MSKEHVFHDMQVESLSLLQAKLAPPRYGRFTVPRRNLQGWLKSCRKAKIVVICAPAGFGKTSLMVQWSEKLAVRGRNTLWLGLDEGDNDPGRLLTCLIKAIESGPGPVCRASLPLERRGHGTMLAGMLLLLRDTLASIISPVTLFLDDLSAVRNSDALEIVEQFIRWLPRSMQIVLASRRMPDGSMDLLRRQGDVVEIGMDDLRFSPEETERFIRESTDSEPTENDVASLQRFTEGWVTGLQLSMLSPGWQKIPGSSETHLTGTFRKISEYLVEDVLAAQPEQVHRFLVQTSILKQFNASLCDALPGCSDSSAMIDYLVKANLFVVPLDRQGHWYRYHSLFARFLRQRLERGRREQRLRLHQAAASWFREQGAFLEAIGHLLTAENVEGAACLMERCALELTVSGRVATVIDWGDSLSMSILARYPKLLLAYGYALLFRQQYEKTSEVLDLLQHTSAMYQHHHEFQDELKTLRALMALFQDRVEDCEAIIMEAGVARTDADSLSKEVGLNITGWLQIARGGFADARETICRGKALIPRDHLVSSVYCRVIDAVRKLSQGQLQQAYACLQEQHKVIGNGPCRYTDAGVAVAAFLGSVLYEMDRLDEAEQLLEPYLTLLPVWASPDVTIIGMITLARIRFAQGDMRGAVGYLTQLKHLAAGNGLRRAIASARLEEIRMAVHGGKLEMAKRLASSHEDAEIWQQFDGWLLPGNDPETPHISRLRFMVATGDSFVALPHLHQELKKAVTTKRFRQAMLLRILLAQALDNCGHRETAIHSLKEAVSAAQGEGFVRIFVDSGSSLTRLLRLLHHRCQQGGSASSRLVVFLDRLHTAMGDSPASTAEFEDDERPVLLEPLTEREMDLLLLLQRGMGNETLAEEMRISVNTVRFHLRNINNKIGAANRTQAVAFGRYLGLI